MVDESKAEVKIDVKTEEATPSPVELMKQGIAELSEQVAEANSAPASDKAEADESDPVEVAARVLGWTPKEEFTGDPAKYVEAGEFIRRQELFDKIKHEVGARKKLEKQMAEITKFVKNLTETEYAKKLAELRAQRQAALEDQDVAKADKFNDEIVKTQEAKRVADEEAQAEEGAEDAEKIKAENQEKLQTWVTKNEWFNKDTDLRELADDYAELFARKNPEATLDQLLEHVDKKMTKHLSKASANAEESDDEGDEGKPEVVPMKKVSKVAAPTTTTTRKSAAGKSKFGRSDLNESQLSTLNNWILPNKIMSEQEYIAQLVQMGEVAKN